ncbi:MAG: DUF3866 family protein [Firmicutes bacterium]|jgi:hypothetical protein|nr:DUF3866 family protein [Bacillota bacterium]MDH7495524.1 DUF3866 family protein [Bacillota bacterium]
MIGARVGVVKSVARFGRGVVKAEVQCEGVTAEALCYEDLTGPCSVGDEVVLNTTAVELGLGTGGHHFVMWVVGRDRLDLDVGPGTGHIMKVRYTPMQVRCLAVEEETSPYRPALESFSSLEGTPVVACELHSMIAPVAAGIKETAGDETRVVYVMTDGGALPLPYSSLVRELREKGLIDLAITCGHAFGGDLEAVSLHSALAAARACARGDAVIVSMGPGQAGTATKYGFSGIQQGEVANAAYSLGGTPVVAPRVSFSDARARHYGVSHHTLTILSRVALARCIVVVPELGREELRRLRLQLAREGVDRRHVVLVEDGRPAVERLKRTNVRVRTMGRGPDEDPAFFLAAGAAGVLAGKIACATRRAES